MFGKLFLKYLPWWAFVPIIALMAPLAINSVQDHLAMRADLDAAKSAPAPDVLLLKDLVLDANRDDLTEIAVLGQFKGRVGDIEAGKIDYGYALLEPANGEGPAVALVTEGYLFDLLLDRIAQARTENGVSLIRGFEEKDHRFAEKIKQSLQTSGENSAFPVYVVEPYWGTRADALDGRLGSNLLFVVISVGFTLIFVGISVTKFVGWILRIQANKNRVRLPDSNPKGQSEARRDTRSETKSQQEHSVVRRRR